MNLEQCRLLGLVRFLGTLEQVVSHGLEQIVQLTGRLLKLLHLDELFLLQESCRLVTVVPVLVMLLGMVLLLSGVLLFQLDLLLLFRLLWLLWGLLGLHLRYFFGDFYGSDRLF